MTEKDATERTGSRREEEYAEMLEAALARPGVREVMEVYEDWKEKDKGLDAYRSAVKRSEQVKTTNYTTPPPEPPNSGPLKCRYGVRF